MDAAAAAGQGADLDAERVEVRLLRPSVRCPHCHRSPRLRIAAAERENHSVDDPGRVLGTLQCHACDRVYPITARAYQEAT